MADYLTYAGRIKKNTCFHQRSKKEPINKEANFPKMSSTLSHPRMLLLFLFHAFSLLDSFSSIAPNVYMKNKYYVGCIDCTTLVSRPRNLGIVRWVYRQSLTCFSDFLLTPILTSFWRWMNPKVSWDIWDISMRQMICRITLHVHQILFPRKRPR